ncbi:MetQ/NlpA family ABC transporter substrate-binding protein [Alkalibacillus aidingensis]|uniref:MetQ/NlpA family ABC transporter substrate-binding protein n=1 Tax=Alkalibacillus aidingensis TaxID=2747607 RepID=UPI001660FBAC|nr:MetQ/NlpA family ABC transporter substrate-binding protein [Alkalibacillus aidingensis]
MKKFITVLLIAFLALALAACGTGDAEEADQAEPQEEENNEAQEESDEAQEEQEEQEEAEGSELREIIIGSANVPHSEILEEAQPLFEEEGIELQIEVYQDYVLPNEDLDNGTLDVNFFQHTPYLEDQIDEVGYDFVSLGGIHIEPMGIYSQNITDPDNVPEGTEVIMSRSVADHGRILTILQENGLISIDEDVDPVAATVDDIVENPLNLEFDSSIDAGLLPEFYEREADALVAINTNYAIEAELTPTEDALFLEASDSPYANVIAVRAEDKDDEDLQKIVEILRTEEIQTFMEEEYEGSIVPANE